MAKASDGRAPAPARLAVWIATAGGVGFGPWAPGTWGALLAVILFALGLSRVGLPIYASVIVVLSLLGRLGLRRVGGLVRQARRWTDRHRRGRGPADRPGPARSAPGAGARQARILTHSRPWRSIFAGFSWS